MTTVNYKLFKAEGKVTETDCLQVNQIISDKYPEYIWHLGTFVVNFVSGQNGTSYLEGCTNCGDCIDDEWFIVYILHMLSQEYIISVQDEDGEFLLIEAADYLPPELEPDNTSNRV
jgi:hypothetical protein